MVERQARAHFMPGLSRGQEHRDHYQLSMLSLSKGVLRQAQHGCSALEWVLLV